MDEGVFGRTAQDRAIAEVELEIARLCELLAEGRAMGLDEGREMVGGAMSEFLLEFFDLVRAKGSRPGMRGMVTLPMLVHGAETGEPGPAAPIAVVHLLWWASARYLDDLTDAPGTPAAAGPKLLTALAVGSHLPARLLAGLPVTATTRAALGEELSRGWLDAVDGQLRTSAAARRPPRSPCCAAMRARPARPTRWPPPRGVPGRRGPRQGRPVARVRTVARRAAPARQRPARPRVRAARTSPTAPRPTCSSSCCPRCPPGGAGGARAARRRPPAPCSADAARPAPASSPSSSPASRCRTTTSGASATSASSRPGRRSRCRCCPRCGTSRSPPPAPAGRSRPPRASPRWPS